MAWNGSALAGIRGEAAIGYVDYAAEDKNGKVVDASSLSQRYSLRYVTKGDIRSDLIGTYKLSVGYQWQSISAHATQPGRAEQDASVSNGRPLVEGELWMDPPQLPLQLKAYVRSGNEGVFLYDNLPGLASGTQLLAPHVPTDTTQAGTNITSGLTLTLGVKNSMTSSYSSLFSLFPMLMVDYKDSLQRYNSTQSRIDTRTRRLSFVSLNKADNWFHYRSTRFDDYLNRGQSYVEDEIQLGTIDYRLRRQWVDLTNWIKISTDGRLTNHRGRQDNLSFEEYDLNFFAIATRRSWEARTFLNFNRLFNQDRLTTVQRAPIYLSGVWDADTNWYARYSYSGQKETVIVGTPANKTNNILTVGVNTFQRSPFTLHASAAVEMLKDSVSTDNYAIDLGAETASTRRFSDKLGLQGRYHVKSFLATDKSGSQSTYLTQDLTGSARYTPNQRLTLTFTGQVQTGTGSNPVTSGNSTVTTPDLGASGNSALTQRDTAINDFVRYNSRVDVGWRHNARLSLFVNASADMLTRPDHPNDTILMTNSGLNYEAEAFDLKFSSTAVSRNSDGVSRYNVTGAVRAGYRPNRDLDTSAGIEYRWFSEGGQHGTYLQALQRLSYVFWSKRGIRAKLAELTEEFEYIVNEQDSVKTQDSKTVRVSGRYYPTSRLSLFASAAGTADRGTFTQAYAAGFAANFKLLEASADYTYATRDLDKRVEKRLSATVRRTF
jgi:hypothetical protein